MSMTEPRQRRRMAGVLTIVFLLGMAVMVFGQSFWGFGAFLLAALISFIVWFLRL